MQNDEYAERRRALNKLDVDDGETVLVPAAYDGSLDDAIKSSRKLGLEGVLAKRRDSRYVAGKRSSSWIKIKHLRMQEVVIGGWRDGNGSRANSIGSLLLGIPDENGLRYVGRVGTGFNEKALAQLGKLLSASERKTSPFAEVPREVVRDAHWVTPRIVGEVAFSEWTRSEHLRHPSWRGIRTDKDPREVTLE
jgi:bifunctional non-homologous end joining protein LigD